MVQNNQALAKGSMKFQVLATVSIIKGQKRNNVITGVFFFFFSCFTWLNHAIRSLTNSILKQENQSFLSWVWGWCWPPMTPSNRQKKVCYHYAHCITSNFKTSCLNRKETQLTLSNLPQKQSIEIRVHCYEQVPLIHCNTTNQSWFLITGLIWMKKRAKFLPRLNNKGKKRHSK